MWLPPTTVALAQVDPYLRRRRRKVRVQAALAALGTLVSVALTGGGLIITGMLPSLVFVVLALFAFGTWHSLRGESVRLGRARALARRADVAVRLDGPHTLELHAGDELLRLHVSDPAQLAAPPPALPPARLVRGPR
jgi:hypothetical protein